MRLAFLTHEPFHPPSGGGSAEALYLVQELVRRGHEVHVFSPPVEEPRQVQQQFRVVLHPFTTWTMGRYTSLRSLKYLFYPVFLERLVMAAARTARFDLVLSQHAISAVAAGRLKRRLGVPVVLNFLDYLTGFMETWPVWLMPPPLLAVLKRYEVSMPCRFTADGVLTVSDPLADLIAKAGYPRERLLPIYYGCDCDLFTLDEEALAARTDAPPTIVMHGSLDHHHLGGIALEAIRRIHARRPEAVFKFVGRPTAPLEHLVRRVRQCAPAARLQRAGFVPYDAVARELAQASVGIVPYEESTGTHCAFVAKTVEYLRVGLPVASTPLESAVRYYRDEPLIRFSTFDGASLGDQVLSWLHEPTESRLAWGRAASQRVGENLDWRAICRKAVDFVEQVWHQAVGRSRH